MNCSKTYKKRRSTKSNVPVLEQNLRKAVLKGDLDEIKKCIENGANPNFISKTIPGQKPLIQYRNALDLCVTKSKKQVQSLQVTKLIMKCPNEILTLVYKTCFQAIIEICKDLGIKLNMQPVDPLILNDETQLKTSVLHLGMSSLRIHLIRLLACLSISQPKKLCEIINVLKDCPECDFDYSAKNNMNALAFLLHIDASITDPREPLKLLIKYGCDPRKRVRIADRKVFRF